MVPSVSALTLAGVNQGLLLCLLFSPPFHTGSISLDSVFHAHPDSSYQMSLLPSLSLSIFISKLSHMIANQSFCCDSVISFGGICRNALFRSLHVGLFTGTAVLGPVVRNTLQFVSRLVCESRSLWHMPRSGMYEHISYSDYSVCAAVGNV